MIESSLPRLLRERDPDFAGHLAHTMRSTGSGRVVLTTGCFDLLHEGHLIHLRAAASAGDLLIVGLNSDSSVRMLKGPERPIQGEDERAMALLRLDLVDRVIVVEGRDAQNLLELLRPDVFVTSASSAVDYPEETRLAASLGSDVIIVRREGSFSTTRIVRDRGLVPDRRRRKQ